MDILELINWRTCTFIFFIISFDIWGGITVHWTFFWVRRWEYPTLESWLRHCFTSARPRLGPASADAARSRTPRSRLRRAATPSPWLASPPGSPLLSGVSTISISCVPFERRPGSAVRVRATDFGVPELPIVSGADAASPLDKYVKRYSAVSCSHLLWIAAHCDISFAQHLTASCCPWIAAVRKKLEPLETYVPAVLLTIDQFVDLGNSQLISRVISIPQYHLNWYHFGQRWLMHGK